MAAVKQYRFRALVTLESAREGPAWRLPNQTRALTAHACCLIQPTYHHEHFPAVIFQDEKLPLWPAGYAMMTIALADGEAAPFTPGQRFTILADGTVGRTIRAKGLVGHGVISCQTSPPPAGLAGDRIHRESAGPHPGLARKPF